MAVEATALSTDPDSTAARTASTSRPAMLFRAAVTVGLAFAVIQITNLLLPGFVIRFLGGDSGLFGLLEMAAAIAGMVALAVVGSARSYTSNSCSRWHISSFVLPHIESDYRGSSVLCGGNALERVAGGG